VAESSSVQYLKTAGRYETGRYFQTEFKHFILCGKTDGVYEGKIVEIKNRRSRFMGVTSYERPQFECYMRLAGSTDLYLCETLKSSSGTQQRLLVVPSDDVLWKSIVSTLDDVSKFIMEVKERPFLQQIERDLLQTHFYNFMSEAREHGSGPLE